MRKILFHDLLFLADFYLSSFILSSCPPPPAPVTDAAPLLDDNHSVDTPDLHGLQPPDGISLESSLSVHTADSHLSTSMDSNSITPSTFLEDLSADLSPTVLPYFIHSEPSTPSQALSLEGEMGSLQEAQIEESAEGKQHRLHFLLYYLESMKENGLHVLRE